MPVATPQSDAWIVAGEETFEARSPSRARTFEIPPREPLAAMRLPAAVRRGWISAPVRALPSPPALAVLLGGGVPRGRISEVVGPAGGGRTSLVHALLAAATAAREVAGVVDVSGAFDPISARRAAVDLRAVLWVRPPSARDGLRCAEIILAAGGFGVVVLDLAGVPPGQVRSQAWPRLARAAERSGAALVVVAAERVAGSFAAVGVSAERRAARWHRPAGAPAMFDGLESRLVVARNKFGPPGGSLVVRWGDACFETP